MAEHWRVDGAALWVVAAGAALGGLARVGVAVMLPGPGGTAVVNVLGAFLIGWLHVATLADGVLPWPTRWRQAVLTGVLGGFTTFSILSAETLAALHAGRMLLAGANLGGSLLLVLLAVTAGASLGRRLNRAGAPRA